MCRAFRIFFVNFPLPMYWKAGKGIEAQQVRPLAWTRSCSSWLSCALFAFRAASTAAARLSWASVRKTGGIQRNHSNNRLVPPTYQSTPNHAQLIPVLYINQGIYQPLSPFSGQSVSHQVGNISQVPWLPWLYPIRWTVNSSRWQTLRDPSSVSPGLWRSIWQMASSSCKGWHSQGWHSHDVQVNMAEQTNIYPGKDMGHRSMYLFVYLFVCLSIRLSVCLAIYTLLICLSTDLSISHMFYLSIYLYIDLCKLSTYLVPIYLTLYLTVCRSIFLSICPVI